MANGWRFEKKKNKRDCFVCESIFGAGVWYKSPLKNLNPFLRVGDKVKLPVDDSTHKRHPLTKEIAQRIIRKV